MEPNNQFSPTPTPSYTPAPTPTSTPTPSPAPQMKPEMKSTPMGTSSVSGPIWLGIAVIIILVVAYFLWSSSANKVNQPKFSSENVVVKTTNVATATGADKLPSNLFKDFPIEVENISESTTLTYPERKAVLYSVTYFSTKYQQDIFDAYGKFLTDNGYKITKTDKTGTIMMYQATKDNNDVTVVITPQPNRMMVQVSYVVRG